jgi:hypothetical protein
MSTSGCRAWNASAAGTVTWGRGHPHAIDRNGDQGLLVAVLDDLLAAVKAGRADVVAQVPLTGGRLDRERGPDSLSCERRMLRRDGDTLF